MQLVRKVAPSFVEKKHSLGDGTVWHIHSAIATYAYAFIYSTYLNRPYIAHCRMNSSVGLSSFVCCRHSVTIMTVSWFLLHIFYKKTFCDNRFRVRLLLLMAVWDWSREEAQTPIVLGHPPPPHFRGNIWIAPPWKLKLRYNKREVLSGISILLRLLGDLIRLQTSCQL